MTTYDVKAMAKSVAKTMNTTDMPSERLVSCTPGALAYRGFATAVELGGADVILMATDMVKLKNAFNAVNSRDEFDPKKAHNVVLTHRDFVELDDEL